jgi:uncharacterized spore protein YtfJ
MAVLGSKSPIKSIQRGSTSLAYDGSTNVTITAVDTDNSFVSIGTKSGSQAGTISNNASHTAAGGITCGAALTATTTLTVYAGEIDLYNITRSQNSTAYWEVIEYV